MRSKDNRTNAFSQCSLPNRDYRRGTFLRTAAAADAFFQIDCGCNAACDLNGGFRTDLDAAAAGDAVRRCDKGSACSPFHLIHKASSLISRMARMRLFYQAGGAVHSLSLIHI